MVMDMRTALARIDRADTKYLPPAFEHDKMRDRGDDRLFRAGHHASVHQGPEKVDRSGLDILVKDELAQREQHILAIVNPYDKDPADLPLRILHVIRFPFRLHIVR